MCFTLMFCVVSGTHVTPPHSTIRPGFPVPVNTNNPTVRKAARFGVYRYNNSSNDLFLFKESQIKKAMVQIVRGLKYMLHVEIKRTVCEKRDHSSLDSCHFQREKNLQQVCVQIIWGNHSPFLLPPEDNYALTRLLDTSVNALASKFYEKEKPLACTGTNQPDPAARSYLPQDCCSLAVTQKKVTEALTGKSNFHLHSLPLIEEEKAIEIR
ncbi:Cystatin-F [Lonchura striata]|uniref:Egg-white cystatin n=1 Tax=Lonchura striata TaxID=40157 RepID=A0A218V782_9PASE|nr:Cystatin-F [Lonchura striata domestica]